MSYSPCLPVVSILKKIYNFYRKKHCEKSTVNLLIGKLQNHMMSFYSKIETIFSFYVKNVNYCIIESNLIIPYIM